MPLTAIEEGRITAIDLYGNRAADELAKAAVELLRVSSGLLQGRRR